MPGAFSESHYQTRLFAEDEVNRIEGDERRGPDTVRVLAPVQRLPQPHQLQRSIAVPLEEVLAISRNYCCTKFGRRSLWS